ncbi:MAG: P-loop NTPase fold protein, partial [Candidatus Hodarchaeota archaeon]
ISDSNSYITALLGLGDTNLTLSPKESASYYSQALKRAKESRNEDSEILALLKLAHLDENSNDRDQAVFHYNQAAKLSRNRFNTGKSSVGNVIQVLQSFAEFYERQGQPENAKKLRLEIESLKQEKKPAKKVTPTRQRKTRERKIVPFAAPTPKVISDMWSTVDRLGYEPHARALATLITHKETRPPLTIGVKAPWGAGKTSLMRMVQSLLDGESEKTGMSAKQEDGSEASPGSVAVDGERQASLTYAQLLEILKDPKKPRIKISPKKREGLYYEIDPRVTVWFNAWKYQNSEQIWAGLAHAIISQVTARLSPMDRELFWLQLHTRRVDVNQVRREVYRVILEEFVPRGLAWAGGVLLLILLALVTSGPFSIISALSSIAPILSGVNQGISHLQKGLKEQLQGAFRRFVRAPSYEGKLGFLHLVESDIRDVLDLVATEDKPLVVFIDDLDRCAPKRVAEIVEAVNLFLAGDYPNCIFVIGMEPELVAAALEVANADLMEKVQEFTVGEDQTPLGWRFMEKIIQLPLTLPPVDIKGLSVFLDSLVGVDKYDTSRQPDAKLSPKTEPQKLKENKVRNYQEQLEKEADIQGIFQKTTTIMENLSLAERANVAEASKRAYAEKLTERDPVIRNFVNIAANQFQTTPRKIKRYINLFRFTSIVRYHHIISQHQSGTQEPDMPPDNALAKFVALSIEWPQALGCLRANSEVYEKGRDQPLSVYACLEKKAFELKKKRIVREKAIEAWDAFIKENGFEFGEWVLEESFREFLANGDMLSQFEGRGLW